MLYNTVVQSCSILNTEKQWNRGMMLHIACYHILRCKFYRPSFQCLHFIGLPVFLRSFYNSHLLNLKKKFRSSYHCPTLILTQEYGSNHLFFIPPSFWSSKKNPRKKTTKGLKRPIPLI